MSIPADGGRRSCDQIPSAHAPEPPDTRNRAKKWKSDLLLLFLHFDPGASRTGPLSLFVVDVPLNLGHRELALSAGHVVQHRTRPPPRDESKEALSLLVNW